VAIHSIAKDPTTKDTAAAPRSLSCEKLVYQLSLTSLPSEALSFVVPSVLTHWDIG